MRVNSVVDVAFAFGPFKLIPRQQLLVRDNRPVKLGGRALDILHLLLMRAGEEVSKTELTEFAWPNVFVDESNLKVHISSLRRALDDTVPQATYIATVAGRGYQFVARVQSVHVEPPDLSDDCQLIVSGLPALPTLVGRQRDVEGVARALDFTKLLTLVGPGGVGKTSLAIAVAHAKRGEFPDGIHFVDLCAINHPTLVGHLMAANLGVRGDPADLLSAVVGHLRNRRMLIILDNCEHMPHAAAEIAERLTEANLSSCLLATSRVPLGVSGENLQRIEPLAFPNPAQVATASEALDYPSVELFALRAFERADYELADGDVRTIASLCEVLDGLPLAIEIVAAKLDRFSPVELMASVGRRLSELRNDDEGTHSRHRTLWATLDWSYQLLSTQEASIFRLLSVFAGSFEWSDVSGMARLVHYDPYQLTVALGGLVSKSLVTTEVEGEQPCYRLLQSARSYAAEHLLQDPLAEPAQRRHAQLVLSVLQKAESEWAWVDNHIWLARYETRIGDLRKALDWCFGEGGDASLGVDIAASAIRLWNEQSSVREQTYQVDRALKSCASLAKAPQHAAVLATSSAWSKVLARKLDAETDRAWNSALSFAERSGDPGQHLSVMFGLAVFFVYTGRSEQAVRLLNKAAKLAQTADSSSLLDVERISAFAEIQLGRLLPTNTTLARLAENLASRTPPSRITRYQLQRYVGIHSTLAFSTWLTGRPELALTMVEEMVLKTGQTGQLMGQSHILALTALPLALWSGQIDVLGRYVACLRSNLDRETIALWEPVHRFYDSVIRHIRADPDAIHDMRSTVEELVRDRFLLRAPSYLGVLAQALLENSNAAEADETIERAFTLQRLTEENWCLPELLRIKAQILAVLGEQRRACTLLARARSKALKIGARYLELRIVNDLAGIAIADGSNEKAVKLLKPLYETFGEKTVTEDLRRSAQLLTAAGAPMAPGPL